jgi:hypothetical protein
MSIYATISSTISKTISGTIGFGQQSFVQRFGAGLSAAYFLADLGSKRGFVHGVMNPVVRVQESVTSTLRSFTAPEFLNGTLLAWVRSFGTSADGLVYIWYDGSGNHRDLTQDTVANMPKIVNAGAMVRDDLGNVSLDFNGTTSTLATAAFDMASDSLSLFMVLSKNVDDTARFVCEFSPNLNNNDGSFYFLFPVTSSVEGQAAMKGTVSSAQLLNAGALQDEFSPFLININANIATPRLQFVANGTKYLDDVSTMGTGNLGNHQLFLGSRNQSSNFFSGKMSSFFVYNDEQTTSKLPIQDSLAKTYEITLA